MTRQYFSSFRGYGKPLMPVGPLVFAQTAHLPTYYIASLGSSGEIAQLKKIALTRKEPRNFVLAKRLAPKSTVYFLVSDRSGEPITWNPVPYESTEELKEYYQGEVGSDGQNGTANRFDRIEAFAEQYTDVDRDDDEFPETASAVLIATGESVDPRLPRIDSVRMDTRRVAEVLETSLLGKFDSIATFTNWRSAEITAQLQRAIEAVSEKGLLFLYFAGHGLLANDGDVLLSTGDTVLDDVRSTSISMRMLSRELHACRGKVIVVLDCCESPQYGDKGEQRVIDAFRALHHSKNVAVIASLRLIANSQNNMAAPLIHALRGSADLDGDGVIGTRELCSYFNQHLTREAHFHWFVGFGGKSFTDRSTKSTTGK
jgi:Caspase domain